MERIFVGAYDYFARRPRMLALVFILITVLSAFFASWIKISENVSDIFPDDEEARTFNQVFQSRALEKLVFMVSSVDSTKNNPDDLVSFADSLITQIKLRSGNYVEQVNFRIDDDRAIAFYNTILEHLPVFLTDKDYAVLDSLLQPKILSQRIEQNYRQLISPSGIFTKKIYTKDIIGISMLGLTKLRQLQYDENYVLYDNCLFTKDFKHLLFFVSPKYRSSNTGENTHLIDALNKIIAEQQLNAPAFHVNYFGGTAVAVGNATQLRSDTRLTVALTLILLISFILWFFRRKRAPLVILIPVAFGALFSLACLAIIKGSVSVITLAAGSIVLGIAVNYSLHFIVHLRHARDKRETIRDLTGPMTLGSATTVLAFFGLQFANAGILRDIGLFAAFSLIGAAICTLLFLPHFFKADVFASKPGSEEILGKFFVFRSSKTKWASISILVLTPVLFYFAGGAKFNSDMNKLNFMSEELKNSQQEFYSINEVSLQSVYIVTKGRDEQEALRHSESLQPLFEKWKESGVAQKYLSPSLLLVSDSLQQARLAKWNSYWTQDKIKLVVDVLRDQGKRFMFSESVYAGFDDFVQKKYFVVPDSSFASIRDSFFRESIVQAKDNVLVITPVLVNRGQKQNLYSQIQNSFVTAIDQQTLTNNFIHKVNADFTFIVTFTSVLVFVALLLAYRKIELALIAFVPMFITWVWILGIMALLGIEFNLINVMVSTFIFGLGDDYSIFTLDALRQQQQGKEILSSVRISVFVSAITTVIGLGVLLFAKHPALQSIAVISITGIVCVFAMTQTVEPFLFDVMVGSRAKRGLKPMTLKGMCITVFVYSSFVLGSLGLSIVGFILLRAIPIGKRRLRFFYHSLISAFARVPVYSAINLKKTIIKPEGVFEKPSIIICNHNSFLDILVTVMLTPRVILLTNKWVWRSPIFGAVVRMAEYYPVNEGAEGGVEKLKRKIGEGFSIVIFPEGTRSPDGNMQRFHKGAFYLAEKLSIGIRPLLIHGTHQAIPKGDFYVNDSHVVLKFLPLITPEDTRFGGTYQERTKAISKYFRDELNSLSQEYKVGEPSGK